MSKYPLIIFEGIESSGKTTLINYASSFLKKNKREFIKIREPGGTKNSEKIRKIILNNKSNHNKKTDLLLILASRSENVEKIIYKNYRKKIILIDRFTDSTIAYQHYGMGINLKLILNINKFLLKNIMPDFTFTNIVNKQNLLKRLKSRTYKNKYDYFDYGFYNKVQRGFLKLSKNKRKYMIINSNKSLSLNKKIITNKIKDLI